MYFACRHFYAFLFQRFRNIFLKLLLHTFFQKAFLKIFQIKSEPLFFFLLVKAGKALNEPIRIRNSPIKLPRPGIPTNAATKNIKITVTGNVNAQINTSAETVTVPAASTDQAVIDAVRAVVTINDNGTVVAGTNTTVTVVLVKDQAGTVTAANVSYKGKNGVTVTKQIKVQFEQATTEQQTTSTESTAQPQQ